MSVIFVDANQDLTYQQIDELGLHLIKTLYMVDNVDYYNDAGREIDFKDFFNRMRHGADVKTAALNAHQYTQYFEPYFAKGEEMLYIAFSTAVSGVATESMLAAVKELRLKYPNAKFTHFNTNSMCLGAGYQTYYAAKMWQKGASIEEIVKFLEEFSTKVVCSFVVNDLTALRKGGRISPAVAFVGGMLGIKPILKVTDEGKIEKFGTAKGARKALQYLADLYDTQHVDEEHEVWIADADNQAGAQTLIEMIRVKYPNVVIKNQMIGPIIGCHCGADTVGIIFYGKSKT